MYKIILPLMIFGSFLSTNADSAFQTDWSGGPGVGGPVLEWNEQFFLADNVEWDSNPGYVVLQHIVEYTVDEYFYGAWAVYSEDIDSDGDMDILGSAYLADDIAWWENNDGSGTSWTEHTVEGDFDGAISVYSEDFDGDGDMDILGAAYLDSDITWWENIDGSGTSWTEHIVERDFYRAASVYSEDIDGDGDMDILGAAYWDYIIAWWENDDGSGTSWTEHVVDLYFEGAASVYSEDIDGDGDMDILGAAYFGDDITWWENNDGSGTSWIEHTVDGHFDGALSVTSQDIDGDSDMDILGAAVDDDDITWWENTDGSGTSWIEHTVDGDFDGAACVNLEDIDSDGDMDILGAARDEYHITWWENVDGSGTSWTEHAVDTNFQGSNSVYSEDIDGDGYIDVLGAAQYTDDITWWNLNEYSSSGELVSSILYLGNDPGWGDINWSASTPSGSSVSFLVRASDDYGNMGVWSDTLTIPCSLEGVLNDYDSFFQYMVLLDTTDPSVTPALQDITLTWNPLCIEEPDEPCPAETMLLPISPNPTVNSPTLRFGLPEAASVALSVFDLSGRLLIDIRGNEYSPGFHDVLIGDLSPGIYFCIMISDDFTATQRFVVIE